ncbi:ATP-binding cassette subfamily B protein [Methanomicrobium sp. W14]|uniref:ABC transporter ATP-binding protein n=1 Tax=Methanomicrobium sp. W14 TaxID=2817839 RepID=UPI001AE186E5|nr:ABC transporter ATP-binding protein [Methanomicrobium sp. W14]MBP2133300.1 ATP-binding cassette subfamily B protein [Methanomicrobium sp. W14]
MNDNNKKILRLFKFAGKSRIYLILACILSAISAVFVLVPFICIYYVMQEVLVQAEANMHPEMAVLLKYGWIAVGSATAGFALYFAALMLSHTAAFRTERNMRSAIMHHIVKLPMGFHTSKSSGKMRKIIDENTMSTENFIAHQMPDLAGGLITPVAVVIMLLYFDWRLGTLSLLTLAAGFLIQKRMIGEEGVEWLKKYQNALEDMNTEAVEYIRGISVVKVFGQTVHSFKNFRNSILAYRDFASAYAVSCKRPMTAFLTVINGAFFLLVPAGILLAGVAGDYMSFVLSFIFYVVFTPACAAMLLKIMYSSSYRMIALESLERIEDILNEKPLEQPVNPEKPHGWDISFENVSFRYPKSNLSAVDDVTFNVPEGTTTALVGPSGSGKTTIANLVLRFWDVDSGKVCLGGADVKKIDTKTLMENISFVFQDSHLLKDSILGNIKASRPDASEEDIAKAIEAAQCTDIIEKMPDGINTVTGTKGIFLSGGEQQRIILARAILKDTPVVILDEATAFADPENEYKIRLAFRELTRNKTVLMIAHRLSTVQDADQILVIDNGRIAEKGTHEQLMDKGGLYTNMWKDYRKSVSWKIQGTKVKGGVPDAA